MKVCVAQTKPFKGDLEQNIEKHKKLIGLAIKHGAAMVVFPELSLTGYEPKLSRELATNQEDPRLDELQKMSDEGQVVIGAGLPTITSDGTCISMIIFQPGRARQTYSKQYLHTDELPYFIKGKSQVMLTVNNKKIAPAICYESLLPEHADSVYKGGAEIYMASVAKSGTGVVKAYRHYPLIAGKYGIIVVMANCVGPSDDFVSAGQSSIWNTDGRLLGQLDETSEGILIADVDSREVIREIVQSWK